MEQVLAVIKEAIRNPFFTFLLVLVSGTILFLPQETRIQLGIETFRNQHSAAIFIVFVTVSGALAYHLVNRLVSQIAEKKSRRIRKEAFENSLKALTYEEKMLIHPYVFDEKRGVYLDVMQGEVASLLRSGVLIYLNNTGMQSASIWGTMSARFLIGIQEEALQYLKENPELLNPTEEQEKRRLEEERQREKESHSRYY